MSNLTKPRPLPPLLAVAVLLVSWSAVARAEAPLTVFVSILPQQEMVREIGGAEVRVEVLVGPGQSPAVYEPTPRQMAALSQASIFFAAGVPFEKGLLPQIKALSPAPRISGPRPAPHEIDPHTWLDPVQAMAQADTVCQQLSRLRPAAAAEFAARRDARHRRLATLDQKIQQLLSPCQGDTFFVFHPAWGHFARRYGLVQVAVEAHGHEPGARQLAGVMDHLARLHARAIFVQPQFSRRSARMLAEATGAEILVLDPLAPDYEANLWRIATTLASTLEPKP